METTKKEFRTRVSVLLIGVMLALCIISASIFMVLYISYGQLRPMLLYPLPYMLFLLPNGRYIIDENKLYFTSWYIPSGSVKISNIASVKRSYTLQGSPAYFPASASSLKKLCVCSVDGARWLISPVKEEEFIQELKAINPDIEIDVDVPAKKGLQCIMDWDI